MSYKRYQNKVAKLINYVFPNRSTRSGFVNSSCRHFHRQAQATSLYAATSYALLPVAVGIWVRKLSLFHYSWSEGHILTRVQVNMDRIHHDCWSSDTGGFVSRRDMHELRAVKDLCWSWMHYAIIILSKIINQFHDIVYRDNGDQIRLKLLLCTGWIVVVFGLLQWPFANPDTPQGITLLKKAPGDF